jgi:hypothetical protein
MRHFEPKAYSTHVLVAIAFVVALASCGTTEEMKQSSTTALSSARSALEEASEAQAATYATGIWAQAREKLSAAEEAMRVEEYQRSEMLAEQAKVDAELAEAKARAAVAEESVNDLQRTVEVLRQETMGSDTSPAE